MKTLPLLLVATLLATVTPAQMRGAPTPESSALPPGATAGPTNINVPTTASELAAGYASAIPQMTLKSIVIYLKSDGKTVPIRGIRSARAMGAVLLLEFSAGDRMAVNAEHVVMITDGIRTP